MCGFVVILLCWVNYDNLVFSQGLRNSKHFQGNNIDPNKWQVDTCNCMSFSPPDVFTFTMKLFNIIIYNYIYLYLFLLYFVHCDFGCNVWYLMGKLQQESD